MKSLFTKPASWLCQLYSQACNLQAVFIQATATIDVCNIMLRLLIIIIIVVVVGRVAQSV